MIKNSAQKLGKNISDTELRNIFNAFLSDIISELNIPEKYHCFLNDIDPDSVLSVLNAFENHPSIKNIKSKKFIAYLHWCSNESRQQFKCSQKLSNEWYTYKGYQNE